MANSNYSQPPLISIPDKPDTKTYPEAKNWYYIEDENSVLTAVNNLRQSTVAVDLETSGLDFNTCKIKGIGFCDGRNAYYTPWDTFSNAIPVSHEFFNGPHVYHNGKFDLKFLISRGYEAPKAFDDTLLLFFIMEPELTKFSLEHLVQLKYNRQTYKVKNPQDKDNAQLWIHCCSDVWFTWQLFNKWYPELPAQQQQLYELECKLSLVLTEVEMKGAEIDYIQVEQLRKEYITKAREIEKEIHEISGEKGWNIRSLPTLKNKLEQRGLKLSGTLDQKALQRLKGDALVDLILKYRKVQKLKSTYIEPLSNRSYNEYKGGPWKIFCNFNQCKARTGRLSSSEPNLQNVDSRLKKVFIAPKGKKILVIDYSQIEMRFFAHYSGEKALIEAFNNDRDVHTETARLIFNKQDITKAERKTAKSINFGLLYGMGAKTLASQIGCEVNKAKELRNQYLETYPAVKKLLRSSAKAVETRAIKTRSSNGYIYNLYKRKRYIPRDKSYIALNTIIQGSAGDFVKWKMIEVHEFLRNNETELILNVHDELVFVYKEEEDLIQKLLEIMEDRSSFKVAILADYDIGTSWAVKF